ncbi:MAG TPA: hypothetical protein VM118_13370 [Acidobacteriota bacterium]|nr:hypothetical protein [Acidobacteriota bacterium]
MKEAAVKLFSDARDPGVISPEGDKGRPIMVASMRSRTSMLKKLTLGAIVSLFAAVSLFGCRSAQEEVNANAENTSTPTSNWPKTLTVPAGTTLLVSLDSPLRTDASKVGDSFSAHLTDAVHVDQMTVLPVGTEVRGRLTLVEEPHRTSGKAQMTLMFDEVVDPAGQSHSISTAPIVLVAEGDKIGDAEKVAAGAVIGGIIGAVSSPEQRAKGAAVGAAAGAVAGGAIAIATKGEQIELPAGQRFAVDLKESLRVSVTQQTAGG